MPRHGIMRNVQYFLRHSWFTSFFRPFVVFSLSLQFMAKTKASSDPVRDEIPIGYSPPNSIIVLREVRFKFGCAFGVEWVGVGLGVGKEDGFA